MHSVEPFSFGELLLSYLANCRHTTSPAHYNLDALHKSQIPWSTNGAQNLLYAYLPRIWYMQDCSLFPHHLGLHLTGDLLRHRQVDIFSTEPSSSSRPDVPILSPLPPTRPLPPVFPQPLRHLRIRHHGASIEVSFSHALQPSRLLLRISHMRMSSIQYCQGVLPKVLALSTRHKSF